MRVKKTKEINSNLVELLEKYKEKKVSYSDAIIEIAETTSLDFEELIEMIPEEIVNEIKKDLHASKFFKETKTSKEIINEKIKKLKIEENQ